MKNSRILLLGTALLAPGSMVGAVPAFAGSFTYSYPPAGHYNATYGLAINDAGTVIGNASTHSAPLEQGFIWAGGSVTNYAAPGGHNTSFTVINAPGLIAGSYQVGRGRGAFVYNPTTNSYQDLPIAGGKAAQPAGINAPGQVVGSTRSGGFLYSGGVVEKMAPPKSTQVQANGLNDSGFVVGNFENKKTHVGYGFEFDGTSYTVLSPPGATYTVTNFITDDGVVGGAYNDSSGHQHGYTFDGTTYTVVDYPGAVTSIPVGIGPGGEVVGNWTDTSGIEHGYVMTGGNYYSITAPTAYPSTEIMGVNASGTLVGTSFTANSEFDYVAFQAVCLAGQAPCTQ
jgi:hypothetical protein